MGGHTAKDSVPKIVKKTTLSAIASVVLRFLTLLAGLRALRVEAFRSVRLSDLCVASPDT
jgi:hypothetical protein